MSRAISGTQDLKGRVLLKQAEGGMERIRCPSCQGIAVPSIDARTGTKVIACGKCGRSYTTRPM